MTYFYIKRKIFRFGIDIYIMIIKAFNVIFINEKE